MTKPIKTREWTYSRDPAPVWKEWSYEDILEVFDDSDHSSLVRPLVMRCQDYEGRIEELEEQLACAHAETRHNYHIAKKREETAREIYRAYKRRVPETHCFVMEYPWLEKTNENSD